MTDKAIILTTTQEKAFKQLEAAFKKCASSGLEIHGEIDTLYAINKKGLGSRIVTTGIDNRVITDEAISITPKAFCGCFADDGLGIA
jgi:hypothetical protein